MPAHVRGSRRSTGLVLSLLAVTHHLLPLRFHPLTSVFPVLAVLLEPITGPLMAAGLQLLTMLLEPITLVLQSLATLFSMFAVLLQLLAVMSLPFEGRPGCANTRIMSRIPRILLPIPSVLVQITRILATVFPIIAQVTAIPMALLPIVVQLGGVLGRFLGIA